MSPQSPRTSQAVLSISGGRRFLVSGVGPTLIGSHGCAILLSQSGVAPQHARIALSSGQYVLEALAETRVNGLRVQSPVVLRPGDHVTTGCVTMVFQLGLAPAVSPIPPAGGLDVLFLFDTTGSMYRYLAEVRKDLTRLIEEMARSISDCWVAVIAYGDHTDEEKTYLVKVLPFVADLNKVVDFVQTVQRTGGGGDGPEALEDALYEANRLAWRSGVAHAIILIGDALPHKPAKCPKGRDYDIEVKRLVEHRTRIHAILCGESVKAMAFFEDIAGQSGGALPAPDQCGVHRRHPNWHMFARDRQLG